MSRIVVFAVLLGTVVAASADNPKFEYGKADEVAKVAGVEWNASAEVGLVFTTGNSETTTVTAGLKAARKTGQNKLAIDASLTYARSSVRQLVDNNGNGTIDDASEIESVSSTTAETVTSKLRYDRFLTDANSLYAAALAARDLPAGKEAVVGGQVGYSRRIYKTKTAEAVAEAGIDYSHEDLVAGDAVHILSARGFVGFKAELTEGATFDASLEGLDEPQQGDPPDHGQSRGEARRGHPGDREGRVLREDREEPRDPDLARGEVRSRACPARSRTWRSTSCRRRRASTR